MKQKWVRRVRAYKEFLRKKIEALKGHEFSVKLLRPLAKEFKAYLDDFHPGLSVANPARDIQNLVSAGDKFDAEFAFLYHGLLCPQFIEAYNEKYLARLVKGVFSPDLVEQRLRRRPDGRPVWEEL